MTKDEARAKLDEFKVEPWICRDKNRDPHWFDYGPSLGGPRITLDGDFSRDELLAILLFHPE